MLGLVGGRLGSIFLFSISFLFFISSFGEWGKRTGSLWMREETKPYPTDKVGVLQEGTR